MHFHQVRRGFAGMTIAVTSVVAALGTAAAAPAGSPEVPGRYIVVLAGSQGPQDPLPVAAIKILAGAIARTSSLGAPIGRQYTHAISGFSTRLTEAQLRSVRADPAVSYVVPDGLVQADGSQSPATWGLDRIDQQALPLNQTYNYTSTGSGVTAYVIDTGIRLSHNEFEGRAEAGFSSIEDGHGTDDCNGHGTHVAGTIAGATYGVAKQVHPVAVRVLDCAGSGSISGVIAGIDWVTAHHAAASVANMSLGGGVNQALDDAVTRSVGSGVTYAVAAGNSNANACNYSPARTPAAITVGATTMTDSRDTSYSNYGNCVDLFAPGTQITSAWNTSDSATNTISGTSMATPHVAGAAVLFLQEHPGATPAQVRDGIVGRATANVVTNAGSGSPNRLLLTDSSVAPSTPFIVNLASGGYLDTFLGIVVTDGFSGRPSQQWQRSGELIRNQATELCLDASSTGNVSTHSCSGASSQNWFDSADGTIRARATGLCLDSNVLALVQARACSGADSQKWQYRP